MHSIFFFISILFFNLSLFAVQDLKDNTINTRLTIENYVFKGPENLKAEVNGIKVKLKWDPINLPNIKYNIYRSTEEQGEYLKINKDEISGNEYLDTKKNSIFPLLSGIKYFYKVSAVDSEKEIGESNIVFAIPTGKLSPPEEVNVIPFTDKILIKWIEPDSSGEYEIAGYNIFRSIDEKDSGIKINDELIKEYEYEDKNIEQGLKYFYRLQSVDVKGNTSELSNVYETMPFVPVSEPLDITVQAKSSESIKISWLEPDIKGSYGIAGYNIFRSENPDSFPEKPINIKLIKQYYDEAGRIFYYDNIINSIEPPQPGKNYYYKIVPIDTNGNTGVASKVVSGTIELLKLKKTGIISGEISEFGLPPESNLTITGSKQIQLSYKHIFSDNAIEQSRFDITQPLKVRVIGNIGKKITVEVDHDDSRTQDEQRKISIKYQGEKEETVQEVNFGDITLDIPATRFVSFSQSLFGINAKIKLGEKFTLSAIAAQTKGITAIQTFKGNLREKEVNGKKGIYISDIDFIKNTYYYITKENVEIKPGSVVVYMDNANINDYNINTKKSYPTGKFDFDLLILGTDYTVDYKNKIIKFNIPIYDHYIIAVAFETLDGRKIGFDASGAFDFNEANLISEQNGITSEYMHLIQDGTMQNPKDISHKVLSFYYLGDTQIYNPKIDKDFVIKIYDMSNKEYYIPYPTHPDADKWYEIDTDFGLLKFKSYFPFKYPNNSPCDPATSNTRIGTEDDAYNTQPPVNSRFKIYLEYKYYVSSFKLDYPSVVYGSEKIFLNGRLLRKDIDYYILYETGEVTFIDKNLIQPDSEIVIVYEYFPFFQAFPSNLYGARAEYKLFDNLSMGTTFLYKSANSSSQIIPDARSTYQGLSTPYRMYILDGDIKFDLKKEQINKILDVLPFIEDSKIPVDFSFQAEMAHSNFNPNIFDKHNEHGVAMIDNIEGADNIISTSMDKNYWFPASRPQASDISSGERIQISKSNITDIDPAPSAGSDIYGTSSRKIMLQFNYNNLTSSKWDAYRYLISSYGENLNNYSYIDMWVYTTQPIEIGVDLGVISEDSNGNSVLDTEDKHGGRPNGILESDEDTGINQSNDEYWGARNTYLDTEDMNNNGILDTLDAYYQYRKQITETGRWINLKIDLKKIGEFTGYNVSLDPASKNFLSLVKHARLVIRGVSGSPVNGYVKIASIDFTGNSWVLKVMPNSYDRVGNRIDSPDVNKFNLSTVNKYTDSSYVPNVNFFEYQREEDKKSEKALKITYNQSNYDLSADGKAIYFATKDLSRSIGFDYQPFKKLRFDIFYSKKDGSSGSGKIFFIRLGTGTSDDNNYYQYNVQLDDVPSDGVWHTVELKLDGSDKKRSAPYGNPNLRQINYITIGVINPNSMPANEIFYVNNFRLTDPDEKLGLGKYTNAVINYSGFGSVSHSYQEIESDFITIADVGRTMVKQHSRKNTINFNYNQISFLPVRNSFRREELFTEEKYREDPEYTSNYIIPDTVIEEFLNSGSFNLIPNFTLSNNITLNKTKNRYIKIYTYQDYDYEKFRIAPYARYSVPDQIQLPADLKIPLGNNTVESNLAVVNEKWDYIQPESIISNFNYNYYDKWEMTREQNYKWTGNYTIDRINLTTDYQYGLYEKKGNLLGRYIYYLDRISPDKYYTSDYILLKRSIMPSLSLSLGEILLFNPQISYKSNYTMDYSTMSLLTSGDFSFMTKIELKKILDILPNISTYNVSISLNENYNDTYYSDSIEGYNKLPFESKWFLNSWENIFNSSKIEELEKLSYNGSFRLSHDLNFSEIKFFDRFSFTPRGSLSIYRSSYSRILNTFTNTINLSIFNMQVLNVSIPGLERFFRNETLTGNYIYSDTKTIDPVNKKDVINETISHSADITLNFKDNDALENPLTGRLGISYSKKDTQNRQIFIWMYTLEPRFQLNYFFKFNEPMLIPSWMPWIGGKAFKLEQVLQWKNILSVFITRGDDVGGVRANKQSNEKYKAETGFTYNFLENVESNFSLIYENNVDRVRDVKYNYSSLQIVLSVTAYF